MCATLIRSYKSRCNIKQKCLPFFLLFHASFTFISDAVLGRYHGVFFFFFVVFLATNIGKFDKPEDWVRAAHWQMKLANGRTGTAWDLPASISKSRLLRGGPQTPQLLTKNSAQSVQDVCANWMCQICYSPANRERERKREKWVSERVWEKSLYSLLKEWIKHKRNALIDMLFIFVFHFPFFTVFRFPPLLFPLFRLFFWCIVLVF